MNKDKSNQGSQIKRVESKKEANKQPKVQQQSELEFKPIEGEAGESVKVALRLRPLNALEVGRNDENCFKLQDGQNLQLINKKQARNFRFNYVLPEKSTQQQVYQTVGINQFLQSALDGYAVTVFAYGQTGSGKTYTMAGNEQKLSQQQKFVLDDRDGIIPRAVRNLWQLMAKRKQQYSLKASFSQIYNEQIRDLLNPASGVLHCRWNAANGFFVQDLLIVDCTTLDDMVAVLLEGMKNRKSGSHELNKDSSRSHSILTMYVISETKSSNEVVRKYGKVSFVDLAGSQRLKESKSQGQMVKETGNINKSLFTLGKVIKGLSDRKSKTPYIPYRDSKLTMLLMDSLGGTSKALMIACASPSSAYIQETTSTLNYATRTMNIKNKPVVQMDPKDQIIYGLMRERELLRVENQYLQEQIQRANHGVKLIMPDFAADFKDSKDLPPLVKNSKTASERPIDKNQRPMSLPKTATREQATVHVTLNKVVQEYQFQLARLQQQNEQLRNGRDIAQKNFHIVINENNALQIKLDNLQQLFIKSTTNGPGGKRTLSEEYMNSNLMAENKMIKDKIEEVQDQIFQLQQKLNKGPTEATKQQLQMKEMKALNRNLAERIDYYQRRERQLTQAIQNKQK